jgi:hypothetical protein
MGRTDVLWHRRVGWWAGGEPADPLAALAGSLLRAEIRARCPGLAPVLVHGATVGWDEPGFTGEPAALHLTSDGLGEPLAPFSVLVASGGPEPGGSKIAHALAETGVATVAIAPEQGWGLEPSASVGPPFALPEPVLLAARHLSRHVLGARSAFLRVVEGLPRHYVLVEGGLLDGPVEDGAEDLELALRRLAGSAGGDRPAEVVKLVPGLLAADDRGADTLLVARRAETEEGRHQPEDWAGDPDRARMALRVPNPVDLAAAVAGAEAVVASSGALMALAWSLGTPHVAVAGEDSPASNFAAWTGDASALAQDGAAIVSSIDNIFARRGRPRGLKRLEATLDQSLDDAAGHLVKALAEAGPEGTDAAASTPAQSTAAWRERAQELEAVNEALRQRLAVERLRFGERSALLERAANTSVESAIKAVHGQDVIVRRRLEQTEKEMRRLQEETALQQAELRAIHASLTMRAMAPARAWYERVRGAAH